jgi:integrase
MPRPANAGRQLPPESVSPATFHRLLAASAGDSPRTRRDRLTLALAYYGGLRAGEVVALTPVDVDRERGLLHVRRGKGNKPRSVWLDPALLPHVDAYLGCRGGAGDAAPLLLTATGRALLTSHLRGMVRRVARRAGIASARGLHPHALRHGAARRWADAGIPMHVVQAALGHTSLTTTSRYLGRVGPDELAGWSGKLACRAAEVTRP